jgi:hypothetical protein
LKRTAARWAGAQRRSGSVAIADLEANAAADMTATERELDDQRRPTFPYDDGF